MNCLCKIGIHRPLKVQSLLFVDMVSHKPVRSATCSCGKKWMTDSKSKWFGTKVERNDP